VRALENSIGYVDLAQATQLKLRYALIQNHAGQFVRPGTASFQAAASSAEWNATRDFHVLLTDSPVRDAYPITATVFALMPRAASRTRTGAVLDFFRWSMEHGSSSATGLGYVPLPPTLIRQVAAYWTTTFAP
jgi:phosphate transport system substrate-binding protein